MDSPIVALEDLPVGFFFESTTTSSDKQSDSLGNGGDFCIKKKRWPQALTIHLSTSNLAQITSEDRAVFVGRLPQNVEKICGKPEISENLCQRIKQNCPQAMKKAGHVGSQNWGIQE